jgi:hypothetical protein
VYKATTTTVTLQDTYRLTDITIGDEENTAFIFGNISILYPED